jgi:hypothetical protein
LKHPSNRLCLSIFFFVLFVLFVVKSSVV